MSNAHLSIEKEKPRHGWQLSSTRAIVIIIIIIMIMMPPASAYETHKSIG
jgi:hypothetical protein